MPVAGEESSVQPARGFYQLSIFAVTIVNDVNSKEAKVPHQFSQVSVGDKISNFEDLQTIFLKKSNCFPIDRKDIDVRFGANDTAEIDRLIVKRIRSTSGWGTPQASIMSFTDVRSFNRRSAEARFDLRKNGKSP
ncbi:MAG TPA: hypothetical protein VMO75_06275 [Chthoniobacterales bacterium]|nr:hypothetical protein [Chthoniobacterales bacterium]